MSVIKEELHKMVDDLPEDMSIVLKGIMEDLLKISIEDRFWLNVRFVSLPPYDWGEEGMPGGKKVIYKDGNVLMIENGEDHQKGNIIVPGDIVLISLQNKSAEELSFIDYRPAVVVACPKIDLRFPVIIIVPLTTQPVSQIMNFPQMEIKVPKNSGVLAHESIALIDQLRSIDIDRVQAYLGCLDRSAYERIRQNILELFQQ